LKTSNLILDFEFDQHLESHKHVINIIMWFRDMGCYIRPHPSIAAGSGRAEPPLALSPTEVEYDGHVTAAMEGRKVW
jgi:hypothetical protein